MYDYKQSKKDIIDILDSKIDIKEVEELPSNDSEYTYDNGIKTWVSSIFIDIVDSTNLFSGSKINQNILGRIIRAFTSEVIKIVSDSNELHEAGIRGDCVFAIYKGNQKTYLNDLFTIATRVNTFLKMFNLLLEKRSLPNISVGIGLGCDKDLVIKAGAKRKTNDKVWIGHSVFDAANLSGIANRSGYEAICMSATFYENIIEYNKDIENLFSKRYSYDFKDYLYQCDVVLVQFNDWINGGMKNE